jgi:hypothetical protein
MKPSLNWSVEIADESMYRRVRGLPRLNVVRDASACACLQPHAQACGRIRCRSAIDD